MELFFIIHGLPVINASITIPSVLVKMQNSLDNCLNNHSLAQILYRARIDWVNTFYVVSKNLIQISNIIIDCAKVRRWAIIFRKLPIVHFYGISCK